MKKKQIFIFSILFSLIVNIGIAKTISFDKVNLSDITSINNFIISLEQDFFIKNNKYTEIKETQIIGGSYYVDEYQTPCEYSSKKPELCFGYQITYNNQDTSSISLGEGILSTQLTIEKTKEKITTSTKI